MNSKTYEPTPSKRVAFLGLGVMGYPMAAHLAAAGHTVTVYNRTAVKAAQWVAEHGHASAATPRAAADQADVVFACVGNDDDLRSVALGESGAFAGMKQGAVFVDHTTASAEVARELSALAGAQGLSFIDAPVSGGNLGAINGKAALGAEGSATAMPRRAATALTAASTTLSTAAASASAPSCRPPRLPPRTLVPSRVPSASSTVTCLAQPSPSSQVFLTRSAIAAGRLPDGPSTVRSCSLMASESTGPNGL